MCIHIIHICNLISDSGDRPVDYTHAFSRCVYCCCMCHQHSTVWLKCVIVTVVRRWHSTSVLVTYMVAVSIVCTNVRVFWYKWNRWYLYYTIYLSNCSWENKQWISPEHKQNHRMCRSPIFSYRSPILLQDYLHVLPFWKSVLRLHLGSLHAI